METVYASYTEKKFINRGFLNGFFCPVYGFGAIVIILSSNWITGLSLSPILSIITSLVVSIFLVTVLEYLTGLLLEKVFNCKCWDYSNDFGNISGYVCVKNSLIWGALAFALIQIVHPFISTFTQSIQFSMKEIIVVIIFVYFILDTMKSMIDALRVRKVIINYANLALEKYNQMVIKYKRFFRAFPRLLIINAEIINRDVRSVIDGGIDKIKLEVKERLEKLQ